MGSLLIQTQAKGSKPSIHLRSASNTMYSHQPHIPPVKISGLSTCVLNFLNGYLYSLVLMSAIFFRSLPSSFFLIVFTDSNLFCCHLSFHVTKLNVRQFLNPSSHFSQSFSACDSDQINFC